MASVNTSAQQWVSNIEAGPHTAIPEACPGHWCASSICSQTHQPAAPGGLPCTPTSIPATVAARPHSQPSEGPAKQGTSRARDQPSKGPTSPADASVAVVAQLQQEATVVHRGNPSGVPTSCNQGDCTTGPHRTPSTESHFFKNRRHSWYT